MGEKGTAAWRALKYAGLVHMVGLDRSGIDKIPEAMDSGEVHLNSGVNAAWDDEKGQWINVATGEALSATPGAPAH